MNATIALILLQDGLTSGLIYGLLALSILLVFLVTRVLWVPAGDFLVLGALTLAVLRQGEVPGTVWILGALVVATAVLETWRAWRGQAWRGWPRLLVLVVVPSAAAIAATVWLAPQNPPVLVAILLVLALVTPIGFLTYRLVFRPMVDQPTLTLMFVAVAVHYVLTGLGLTAFGSESFRSPPFVPGRLDVGFTRLSYQLLIVMAVSTVLMAALAVFFGRTLSGKALRATAMQRFGARLVGIKTESMGALAFTIAALIGAISGVLIGPMTALYYDSGFLVALKGFVGTVVAGMASFPLSVLGAILVGLVETGASFYASPFKEAIVFGLLVPFLLWRSAVQVRTRGKGHE
jgi:branched-chain amino acid transport system permease protein